MGVEHQPVIQVSWLLYHGNLRPDWKPEQIRFPSGGVRGGVLPDPFLLYNLYRLILLRMNKGPMSKYMAARATPTRGFFFQLGLQDAPNSIAAVLESIREVHASPAKGMFEDDFA